ncbi:hypothetical protein [Sporomusa sphaeroides]|uniref:Uncharacterized protein n=1 Tax=Sporomusa sphaeroides DSM 2875 TaxID=1337886 RepID=A0ABM9VXG6_9FIRM|nr:hypothetical protein [Sporomusa sphaeroides]OLS58281.1 hypothetical protein SPSPH_18170 [Sporomusa sphaeroides DSM 2875]CVK17532.1 hypothetical protein SSPH_00166 [Sporomusa sphaeroides DSM 2875]
MMNDVKTTVVVMQTDGQKTNLFIYGAKSIKELHDVSKVALKLDNCSIHYIDKIDSLAKVLVA